MFSFELAESLSKKSCKHCYGKGYLTISFSGEKTPIVNPYYSIRKKVDRVYKKVNIPRVGTRSIFEENVFCSCSRKRLEGLK